VTRPVLYLFDRLAGLVRRLGGDYPQFRAILEAKLILDSRRQGMFADLHPSRQKKRGAFNLTLLLFACMGAPVGATLLMVEPALMSMGTIHLFIMTMMTMSLLADFSSVLLDTADNLILLPRPVSGRTLVLARLAHIATYLGLLALSLSLGSLVFGTWKWGLAFAPVFVVTLALSMLLVLSLAGILYLCVLRFAGRERLRDIIVYAQVVMTAIVVLGYQQVLPRLMVLAERRFAGLEHRGWAYLLPPLWLAAPLDILAGRMAMPQIIMTVEALILPPLALLILARHLAPRFQESLAGLEAGAGGRFVRQAGPRRQSLAGWIASVVSRDRTGQALFEFLWRLCSRDRHLKMRAYPNLLFIPIAAFGIIAAGQRDLATALEQLPHTSKHLVALYVACATVPPIVVLAGYSDEYEAAWIFLGLPFRRPGRVLLETVKVVGLRFVLPIHAAICALVLLVWGRCAILDVLVATAALVLVTVSLAYLMARRLPFSQRMGTGQRAGGFGGAFLHLVVPALIGVTHYALRPRPWTLVGLMVAFLLAAAVPARAIVRTEWAGIRRASQ